MMKMIAKKMFVVFVAVVAVVATSCGTSEKNYRQAYEKAKEKETDGLENTIYNRIREQAQVEQFEFDGATVTVVTEYVAPAKDAGFTSQQLKKYNVVVAQFKQLFHAKSMCSRMAAGGYTGAIVIQTAEPLYYVVASSTPTLREARAAADSLAVSSPVKLSAGFPFILRAPGR